MRNLLALTLAIALSACASLANRAQAAFDGPALAGARWGLVAATLDGRELVAMRPDERFLPGSNTKLFTVAAAFHRLGAMRTPDPTMGTSLRLVPHGDAPPDLVLVGGGDPVLVDGADCQRDCLSDLANVVVTQGVTEIGALMGDDRLLPAERWPPGWAQEDTLVRSGAPVSALTVNSNEMRIAVTPGETGRPAALTWLDQAPDYRLAGEVMTADAPDAELRLSVDASGDSHVIRFSGAVPRGPTVNVPVAVQSPAETAAARLATLLRARGVKIARIGRADGPLLQGVEIGRLLPPPLIEDVTFLSKQSQNLHAELLLRRLGRIDGDGSREAGLAVLADLMAATGAPRWSWDFSDGSGVSAYNRVTPRAVVALLRWTQRQSWAAAFRAVLPVGGVDGTLRNRFKGAPLEGRVFAKTGTLRGTSALSGFMTAASGQTIVFAAFVNDRAGAASEPATAAIDRALLAIAAAN